MKTTISYDKKSNLVYRIDGRILCFVDGRTVCMGKPSGERKISQECKDPAEAKALALYICDKYLIDHMKYENPVKYNVLRTINAALS